MNKVSHKDKFSNKIIFLFMIVLSIFTLAPIVIVLMNSFKSKLYISNAPFKLPTSKTFSELSNYIEGIRATSFWSAAKYSIFITICSVLVIVLLTSMTAWYITRVKNKFNQILYYVFAFSMIVPFQMVMFTMTQFANILHLNNPVGLVFLYLGIGSGLCVFMFCGFVKSIPIELEEASMIDGCNTIQTFFRIIIHVLKPITVTVAILETMWIWNDYLLPYLVVGTEYRTIPIAIQYLRGGHGSIDMGAMMAMLVLALIPIVVFYMFCQRYIIEGAIAGAVKG